MQRAACLLLLFPNASPAQRQLLPTVLFPASVFMGLGLTCAIQTGGLLFGTLTYHSCLNASFPFATSVLLPPLPLQKDKPYYLCPNPYL